MTRILFDRGQGEGGRRKPPLRCGKKTPDAFQPQELSPSRRTNLKQLCDQAVFRSRGVDDQLRLPGLVRLSSRQSQEIGDVATVAVVDSNRSL